MKKTLILFCVVFLLFTGCENENFSSDEFMPNLDPDKTFLEITNNSQFAINIYFNSSLKTAWSKVLVGETITKEINLDDIKNRIYIEYEYKINSTIIPFFDFNNIGCVKTIPIRENQINTLEISKLTSLSFNTKTYLIIQNKTTDYIYVEEQSFNKINEIYQNASDEYWINPQSNAVYNISNINLKDCYIINGNSNLNLNLGKLKSGRVYSVCYDGKDISVKSIDLGINPKDNNGLPIYVISSAEDLKKLSNYNDVNSTFELTQNIDGKNTVWNPINTFKGTLIGNGFSISNLKINSESELDKEVRKHNIQELGSGYTYYQPAYCGFFYKNNGVIKNIFFKNITVNAYFEYQTDNWRHVYVGSIAGQNNGTIKNVHLENINITSTLNHQKNKNGTPLQMNITGGVVGENKGNMSFCSIRNSEISASTSAKKNRCYTSTYVGGICGELSYYADNILSISTSVNTHSEGGFMDGWLTKDDLNDGILRSYAGNVFGFGNENNEITRIISYKGKQSASTYAISHNPTEEKKTGYIEASNITTQNYTYTISNLEQLEFHPILEWENWSILGDAPENYMDFLY